MTPTEKAIRGFCGRHADWWPSTTQVQEMLALAQPCPTCEALARTVMLDQTSHDAQREFVGLTDEERKDTLQSVNTGFVVDASVVAIAIEAKLKQKNGYAEEKNT